MLKIIIYRNGTKFTHKIYAIISPELKHDILIGYGDLIDLNVINSKFPIAKFQQTNDPILPLKNAVLNEFPDVLHSTLPDTPMKAPPPKKIDLNPNAVPKQISYAKAVPLHKEKEMLNLVVKALREGQS